jgi:hypothetical protein
VTDLMMCSNCQSRPSTPALTFRGWHFCTVSCKHIFMSKLLHSGEVVPSEAPAQQTPDPEVFQITAEAFRMKQYLRDLAAACEERVGAEKAKLTVKLMGAEIVRLITTQFGDSNNLEAIATVARVLLYILDETEKRSTKTMALKELPPSGGLVQ